MKYYLAPMEGITGQLYRSAYFDFFHNIDKYFTPFLTPHEKRNFSKKELRDILPENNYGRTTVPQILTNHAQDFLRVAGDLQVYDYEEVNLNLGCPSGTVVSKGRGAGFLGRVEELDRFLDEVFSAAEVRISVKTRIGMESAEEFPALLTVFNRYPISELIVHPRTRKDQYKNTPDLDAFGYAVENSKNPVVYNGDLFSVRDYRRFVERFPATEAVMIGRGILINPCLIDAVRGEGRLTKEILKAYHARLYADYAEELSGEKNLLFKMKELWLYQVRMFSDYEKYWKKIRKANNIADFEAAVTRLFEEQELVED